LLTAAGLMVMAAPFWGGAGASSLDCPLSRWRSTGRKAIDCAIALGFAGFCLVATWSSDSSFRGRSSLVPAARASHDGSRPSQMSGTCAMPAGNKRWCGPGSRMRQLRAWPPAPDPPPALYPRLTSRVATAIYPAPGFRTSRSRVPYPFTPVFFRGERGRVQPFAQLAVQGGGSPGHPEPQPPHNRPSQHPIRPFQAPMRARKILALAARERASDRLLLLPSATAAVGAGVDESGNLAKTRANSMAGGGCNLRHLAPECRAGARSAPSRASAVHRNNQGISAMVTRRETG
jgi:hypothetical protein